MSDPLPCGLDVDAPACRPPVYCIGDSHVSLFSGLGRIQPLWPDPVESLLPPFRPMRLGAVLAFSLARWDTTLRGREALFLILDRRVPERKRVVPEGATVLLCFGEIDCRFQIPKHAEKTGTAIGEVVDATVDSYFGVIEEVRQLGYRIVVWAPGPSKREEGKFGRYPSIGTMQERNTTTMRFIERLRTRCEALGDPGVQLASITDRLIDEEMVSREEFFRDRAHLSNEALAMAFEAVGDALDWPDTCTGCPVALR